MLLSALSSSSPLSSSVGSVAIQTSGEELLAAKAAPPATLLLTSKSGDARAGASRSRLGGRASGGLRLVGHRRPQHAGSQRLLSRLHGSMKDAEDEEDRGQHDPGVSQQQQQQQHPHQPRPDWEDTLQDLQSQIVSALTQVDKNRVEVTVGQTSIERDRAVVLAWGNNQRVPHNLSITTEQDEHEEKDGLLLYLAIRYKKKEAGVEEGAASAENSSSTSQQQEQQQVLDVESGLPEAEEKRLQRRPSTDDNNNDNNNNISSLENDDRDGGESNASSTSSIQSKEGQGQPKEGEEEDVEVKKTGSESHELPTETTTQEETTTTTTATSEDTSEAATNDDESVLVEDLLNREIKEKKKKKKSVRWKERLEEEVTATRDTLKSARRSRRDALNLPLKKPHHDQNKSHRLRRTLSLDDTRPASVSPIPGSLHSPRDLKRSRSSSSENYPGPVGVLTTNPPAATTPSSPEPRTVPQLHNMIRRIRSKHIKPPANLWFIGTTEHSFNSRCSDRYDINGLEYDSRHYFYFRSLPRVSPQFEVTPVPQSPRKQVAGAGPLAAQPGGRGRIRSARQRDIWSQTTTERSQDQQHYSVSASVP